MQAAVAIGCQAKAGRCPAKQDFAIAAIVRHAAGPGRSRAKQEHSCPSRVGTQDAMGILRRMTQLAMLIDFVTR